MDRSNAQSTDENAKTERGKDSKARPHKLITPRIMKITNSEPKRYEGGGTTDSSSDFDRDSISASRNASRTQFNHIHNSDLRYEHDRAGGDDENTREKNRNFNRESEDEYLRMASKNTRDEQLATEHNEMQFTDMPSPSKPAKFDSNTKTPFFKKRNSRTTSTPSADKAQIKILTPDSSEPSRQEGYTTFGSDASMRSSCASASVVQMSNHEYNVKQIILELDRQGDNYCNYKHKKLADLENLLFQNLFHIQSTMFEYFEVKHYKTKQAEKDIVGVIL